MDHIRNNYVNVFLAMGRFCVEGVESWGDVKEPLDIQIVPVPSNHEEGVFISDFEVGVVDSDVLYKLALLPAVGRTVETADNDSLEMTGGLLWSDESPNNFQVFGNDDIQLCEPEGTFNQRCSCTTSSSVWARVGDIVNSFQLKGFFNLVLMTFVLFGLPDF